MIEGRNDSGTDVIRTIDGTMSRTLKNWCGSCIVLIINDKLNEVKFIKNFLNLKLNICEVKTINFLDLSISFDTNVNKLNLTNKYFLVFEGWFKSPELYF